MRRSAALVCAIGCGILLLTQACSGAEAAPGAPAKAGQSQEETLQGVKEIQWEKGYNCRFLESGGVSLSLRALEETPSGIPVLQFVVRNENDFAVQVSLRDLYIDDVITAGAYPMTVRAEGGMEYANALSGVMKICRMAGLKTPSSLSFSADIVRPDTGEALADAVPFRVRIGGGVKPVPACEPILGAKAGRQLLTETGGVRAELLELGQYLPVRLLDGTMTIRLKFVNGTGETMEEAVKGISVNGAVMDLTSRYTAGPGETWYPEVTIGERQLRALGSVGTAGRPDAIEELSLLIGSGQEEVWCPVELGTGQTENAAAPAPEKQTQPEEIQEDPAGLETAYTFPLFSEGGSGAELLYVQNLETGGRKTLVRARCGGEEPLYLTLRNFVINDTYHARGNVFLSAKPGEEVLYDCADLLSAFKTIERDTGSVKSFSCSLKAETGASAGAGTVLSSTPCTVRFPAGLEPRAVCEPALSLQAEPQVLREDAAVRLTLLTLGRYVGADHAHALQGVLKAENLSDSAYRVDVQGAKINGTYAGLSDGYGAAGGELKPGKTLYTSFSLDETVLKDCGIEEVEDILLQVLISQPGSDGLYDIRRGGEWIPVTLSAHGRAGEPLAEGTDFLENELVRIGCRGGAYVTSGDAEELPETMPPNLFQGTPFETEDGTLEWYFTVENKTKDNLLIVYDDFEVTGGTASAAKYVMACRAGASAVTSAVIRVPAGKQTSLPEIAFRVRILTAGGDQVLFETKERCRLQAQQTVDTQ